MLRYAHSQACRGAEYNVPTACMLNLAAAASLNITVVAAPRPAARASVLLNLAAKAHCLQHWSLRGRM